MTFNDDKGKITIILRNKIIINYNEEYYITILQIKNDER